MEKNKVVIISGGTSGIGLATAKILASEGWKTILLGRDMSKGRGAQEKAQGSIFIPCDVTNTRIVKNAIEKAASFGEIRGVVSCAGIYTEGLLDNVTDKEMQKFFEVNVFGTIKLLRAAVPFLRMHGGSIVTVASDAAIQGNVQCSLYSATKGAVTAFTRSLALELAVDNVRANVVCPGDVATPLLEKQLQTYGGSINEMKNWYPLMRIADAEEIGQVIAFLISEKSSYMTGAVIPVDGGLTDW